MFHMSTYYFFMLVSIWKVVDLHECVQQESFLNVEINYLNVEICIKIDKNLLQKNIFNRS